jgi:hypothetical protein
MDNKSFGLSWVVGAGRNLCNIIYGTVNFVVGMAFCFSLLRMVVLYPTAGIMV